MKVKPVKSISNESGFRGMIPDMGTYERLKNGETDWKDHVKNKLKDVVIPYELFVKLMEQDKQIDNEMLDKNSECDFEVTDIWKNVTVFIKKCKDCGAIEIVWEKQEDTVREEIGGSDETKP